MSAHAATDAEARAARPHVRTLDPIKHRYVRYAPGHFFIWPDTGELVHYIEVGRILCSCTEGRPMSAGIAFISASGVTCLGGSESLGINSLPDDSAALALQLGLPAAPPVSPSPITNQESTCL